RRARRWGIFFKLLTVAFLFVAIVLPMLDFEGGASRRSSHTALIDVQGVIADKESASAENITTALRDAFGDEKTKGVILRINSPGGSPVQSGYVYDEIRRLRAEKPNIKVYAVITDLGASGAYYIASACDVIYANPSTLTGSIGVIMQVPNYTDLSNKIGVQTITIKSGKFKDIGNGARKMTDDEKTLLQVLINDTYGEFVKAVARGRKMPESTVRQLGDGRIYTGNQAKANKLVDKLGTEADTINDLAKSINVSGEPKLKNYSKQSWEKLFDISAKSFVSGTILEAPEFSTSLNKIPLMLYK
ncbi:MAG: signal peptide peptidase SppA, partial [Pedobacter sp.]